MMKIRNCFSSQTVRVVNHGSLFSGIGGFDLAAEWMGWENVFHCEINPFGQKVLKYYWPKAISYDDITKTDFSIHRGNIDILTGGFPCQPYSQAGKRLGTEDDRHLWPEMLRAVREIQPRWIVGENVYGLVNWSGGLVFEEVQADLENEGYEVQPYILPACGKNAPHRRDRIWFVAHSNKCNDGRTSRQDEGKSREERLSERHEIRKPFKSVEVLRNTTNAISKRLEGGIGPQESIRPKQGNKEKIITNACSSRRIQDNEQQQSEEFKHAIPGWKRFPTQSPLCFGDDGLSERLDGITFPKWRSESIKAAGNAIVPQVVYEIFKAIETYEHVR